MKDVEQGQVMKVEYCCYGRMTKMFEVHWPMMTKLYYNTTSVRGGGTL